MPVQRPALLIVLAAAGIAGCVSFSSPEPRRVADALPPLGEVQDIGDADIQRPITGTCGMEYLQHYVGQPRANVDRRSMPANYRVVGPDSVATMDYREDRLTIRVDRHDRIESMSCG